MAWDREAAVQSVVWGHFRADSRLSANTEFAANLPTVQTVCSLWRLARCLPRSSARRKARANPVCLRRKNAPRIHSDCWHSDCCWRYPVRPLSRLCIFAPGGWTGYNNYCVSSDFTDQPQTRACRNASQQRSEHRPCPRVRADALARWLLLWLQQDGHKATPA